jgi:hypothetical protein
MQAGFDDRRGGFLLQIHGVGVAVLADVCARVLGHS